MGNSIQVIPPAVPDKGRIVGLSDVAKKSLAGAAAGAALAGIGTLEYYRRKHRKSDDPIERDAPREGSSAYKVLLGGTLGAGAGAAIGAHRAGKMREKVRKFVIEETLKKDKDHPARQFLTNLRRASPMQADRIFVDQIDRELYASGRPQRVAKKALIGGAIVGAGLGLGYGALSAYKRRKNIEKVRELQARNVDSREGKHLRLVGGSTLPKKPGSVVR